MTDRLDTTLIRKACARLHNLTYGLNGVDLEIVNEVIADLRRAQGYREGLAATKTEKEPA